jgi:DNA-binding NtrC family response regulator
MTVTDADEQLELDIQTAANTPVNVLITGADPATRLSIARRIHERSGGRGGVLVIARGIVDPDFVRQFDEIDPELPCAIFIDDISWLDGRQQRALMEVLDRKVLPGSAGRGWRIIAGAGPSLQDQVSDGDFLPALFYRLNVIHVVVPRSDRSINAPQVRSGGHGYAFARRDWPTSRTTTWAFV